MKLVITGFMGCGKTWVARELARHLNLEMIDLDDCITQREGRSPAQLIKEEGEPAFRSIESAVLCEVLETEASGVIALGGGAWIEERNRSLIDQFNCVSVWLDVPFEVCWSRIEASEKDRPLGKTRDEAHKRYDRRRPVYQLAQVQIEVGPEDTLESLLARIEAHLGSL